MAERRAQASGGEVAGEAAGETLGARVTIRNRRGLHARASAKFVNCVERFDARVRVSRCGQTVGGTSIMGLMLLAAGPGCELELVAEGAQREEVLAALEKLVAAGFNEKD